MRTRLSLIAVALLIGLLILGLCVRRAPILSPLLAVVEQQRVLRRDLAEGRRFPPELARAQAAGLPTRMSDLEQPLPPPGQNAAPVYMRLTELLKARPLTPEEEPADLLRTGPLPSPAQWARVACLERERPEILRLVHEAAARPRCVFARNWTPPDPATIQFPELATIRESARLVAAESLLLAHQGRLLEAVKNQSLGFQIARHGASDNTLIAGLVSIAVDAITLRGLEKIMYLAGPNAAVDDAVAVTIARNWRPRSLASALKTELAFDVGEIAYLRSHPNGLSRSQTPAPEEATLKGAGWNAYLDYNGLYVLTQMRKAIDVADRPYPRAIRELKSVGDDLQDRRHGASRIVADILLPDPAVAALKWAQIEALANVDRDGAATLAQYARTGHVPDRPGRADPDPLGLRPLRYRREGKDGFMLYSVGPDGHWDGRDLKDAPKRFHAYFRYPAARPQELR